MKRAVFALIVVLLLGAAFVALAARRAPALLVSTLEKELGKQVSVASLKYSFPGTVELRKLAIIETGEFKGETSLYVENVQLKLDTAALMAGRVSIDEVEIQNPQITIRKYRAAVVHALSEAKRPARGEAPAASEGAGKAGREPGAPLRIGRLVVRNGILKWIDYDIAREGFAVLCQNITADIRDLALDRREGRMKYEVSADVAQSRTRKAARLEVKGWTNPRTLDTDTAVTLTGLWLPYFEPYTRQVTSSVIRDGTVDVRSNTSITRRQLLTNARLELSELQFASFEQDGRLFGIEAAPLIDILRSRSGRITLDIVVQWDMNDPGVTFEQVMRRSIEQSLKATFLNNIQNVVTNALDRLSEDPDALKRDWNNVLGEIKKVID